MEELNEYTKHILEFDKTINFFVEQLKNGNTLSQSILEKINLEEGMFFTFLKKKFNINSLYEFKQGGVVPQTQEAKKLSSGHFIPLTSTFDKLYEFTSRYLSMNENNYAIFEEVVWKRDSKNIIIPEVKLCFNNDDVYYVVSNQTSKNNLTRVLQNADGIWHFLGAYSNGKIDSIPTEIDKRDFYEICKGIVFLMVGAYDGESFIFWERKA